MALLSSLLGGVVLAVAGLTTLPRLLLVAGLWAAEASVEPPRSLGIGHVSPLAVRWQTPSQFVSFVDRPSFHRTNAVRQRDELTRQNPPVERSKHRQGRSRAAAKRRCQPHYQLTIPSRAPVP